MSAGRALRRECEGVAAEELDSDAGAGGVDGSGADDAGGDERVGPDDGRGRPGDGDCELFADGGRAGGADFEERAGGGEVDGGGGVEGAGAAALEFAGAGDVGAIGDAAFVHREGRAGAGLGRGGRAQQGAEC